MTSSSPISSTVVIRAARPGDALPLARLAALDSAAVPAGDVVLAEIEGEIVAAVSVDGAARIADPFRRTADVLALLDLRVAALRPSAPRGGLPARFGFGLRAARARAA
jgi:hypothetical protein